MAGRRWIEACDCRPDSRVTGRPRAFVLAGYVLLVVVGAMVAVGGTAADERLVLAGMVLAVGGGAVGVLGPGRFLLPGIAVATAGVAMTCQGAGNVGWFATAVLAAWCMAVGKLRVGLTYLAGLLALFTVEWVWLAPDSGWPPWMAGVAVSAAAAHAGRRQAALTDALRAAQDDLDARVRSEERARIARELHDIIAHSLTVTLLHLQGARLSVEHDPDDAARALDEAERLARQSLEEIRGAVGLLRENADRTDALAPLPGLDALPALVAGFRSAGCDVRLDTTSCEVPSTVSLALYRVAQEALSNAARHGGPGPVAVELSCGACVVRLTVSNPRPEVSDRHCRAGLGLVSMRERVEALGGTLQAGPGPGGWRVQVALPVPGPLSTQDMRPDDATREALTA